MEQSWGSKFLCWLSRAVGWFLIACGVVFIGVEIDNVSNGKTEQLGVGLFITLVCLVGGALMVHSGNLPAQVLAPPPLPPAPPSPDKIILTLAKSHQGRVTAAEIAAESDLDLSAARDELDRLTSEGACRSYVGEGGFVVYHFPEFEPGDTKKEFA